MHPKNLSIKDFTYDLPDDRIAKYPLAERDQSKLLIWQKGIIQEDVYAGLCHHLPENSLLVFNNTKVVEARLQFQKSNGSTIEIFCLEPHEKYPDITTAMLQKEKVLWKCLVGGAKKWKEGSLNFRMIKEHVEIILSAKKIEQRHDYYVIEFVWDADFSFAEILHLAGAVPLPPYLNRMAEDADKERYQTIYARHDGSVAAPTAGLHFTEYLFTTLKDKNISHDFVTLHVGAGTFKPVKSETMESHNMHAEFIDVTKAFIENLSRNLQHNIIAVGTTSLRTIESLFWLGVKIKLYPAIKPSELYLTQWEAYEMQASETNADEALRAVLNWLDKNQLDRLLTKTQIIIAPGYRFRIIQALVTNFHQPQSTLLLLVAAITGNDWKRIYTHALQHDFRFLSYGDGNLLWAI